MMKMGKLCKWGKVVLAGFVLPVAMVTMGTASYAMAAVDSPSPVRSLEEILNSPDIQLSEKAKVGGRVSVVENLEDYYGEKVCPLSITYAALWTATKAAKGAKFAAKGAKALKVRNADKAVKALDRVIKSLDESKKFIKEIAKDKYIEATEKIILLGTVAREAIEIGEDLGEALWERDFEKMGEIAARGAGRLGCIIAAGDAADICKALAERGIDAAATTVDGIREDFERGFTGIGWTPPEPFVPDFDLLMPDFDLAQQAFPGLFEAHPTPAQLINNHEFTTGLEFWETYNNPFVATSFGPIGSDAASLDGSFAVVHTGLGDPNDLGFVQQHLTVPSSTQAVFNMLYNFVTCEFPDWHYAGVLYDDFFKVTIKGPIGGIGEPGEMVLAKMRAQTDMTFTRVHGLPADVLDRADTDGGQTGWKLHTSPSLPLGKGMYLVRIEVQDVYDNIFDSAILIDRVSLR